MKEIKGAECKENDVYFALDLVTGYPVRKFSSYVECVNFCRLNVDSFYPVTNDFEVIVDW